MKLAIVLAGAFITGLITISSPVKDIRGTWVMKSGSCNPALIRISMQEGIWIGKMDIPEQQVYDKEVYAVVVKGDSVLINVSEAGNSIHAVLKGSSTLTGDLITDSGQTTVEFTKR